VQVWSADLEAKLQRLCRAQQHRGRALLVVNGLSEEMSRADKQPAPRSLAPLGPAPAPGAPCLPAGATAGPPVVVAIDQQTREGNLRCPPAKLAAQWNGPLRPSQAPDCSPRKLASTSSAR
jgi:hypothetical protein